MSQYKNKQVYIMRKDLGMRQGKMCSQAAHAMSYAFDNYPKSMKNIWNEWKEEGEPKITVRVDSIEEFKAVKEKLNNASIPFFEVIDRGHTEFNGKQTLTCCVAGPWPVEEIDKITKNLKLL